MKLIYFVMLFTTHILAQTVEGFVYHAIDSVPLADIKVINYTTHSFTYSNMMTANSK